MSQFIFLLLTLITTQVLPLSNTHVYLETPPQLLLIDSRGKKIHTPLPSPLKIISLSPSLSNSLKTLTTTIKDNSVLIINIPQLKIINEKTIETIEKHQPHLVVSEENISPKLIQHLENKKISVIILESPKTFSDFLFNINALGKITGQNKQSKEITNTLKTELTALLQKTIHTRPLVYFEIDASNPYAPWTTGNKNFINTLIFTAGGENIATTHNSKWQQISFQDLKQNEPDLIIVTEETKIIQIQKRPLWNELNAVKKGHIYYIKDTNIFYPGIELLDTLSIISNYIQKTKSQH
jgi:ABC-type Fe3+-hydroxamate transport system substrate-binding protein